MYRADAGTHTGPIYLCCANPAGISCTRVQHSIDKKSKATKRACSAPTCGPTTHQDEHIRHAIQQLIPTLEWNALTLQPRHTTSSPDLAQSTRALNWNQQHAGKPDKRQHQPPEAAGKGTSNKHSHTIKVLVNIHSAWGDDTPPAGTNVWMTSRAAAAVRLRGKMWPSEHR